MDLIDLITLTKLHKKIPEFSKELIGDRFQYEFNKVLTRRQRQLLLLFIDGLTLEEVAKCQNLKVSTVKRRLDEIRYIYRNGFNPRVDNTVKLYKYLDSIGKLPKTVTELRKFLNSRNFHKWQKIRRKAS